VTALETECASVNVVSMAKNKQSACATAATAAKTVHKTCARRAVETGCASVESASASLGLQAPTAKQRKNAKAKALAAAMAMGSASTANVFATLDLKAKRVILSPNARRTAPVTEYVRKGSANATSSGAGKRANNS